MLKDPLSFASVTNSIAKSLAKMDFTDPRFASEMYGRLVEIINDFESTLPETMQAAGRLVSFGNVTFCIDDIGYWNPDVIVFFGTLPDGSSVELVQHTSQLNLLLTAVERLDRSKPRRKIGFSHESQEAE